MVVNDWQNVPDDISEYVGFVYLIENTINGKLYIGKKFYWSKVTRPPLKGRKRRRRSIKESDWKDYYGSCKTLTEDVEKYGKENFRRTILQSYKTKWECSYYEMKEQVDREVLFKDDYYNGIISVKVHKAKQSLRFN